MQRFSEGEGCVVSVIRTLDVMKWGTLNMVVSGALKRWQGLDGSHRESEAVHEY